MIDLRSLRFGVEVETVGRTRHQVAQAIQSVVGGEVNHIGTPSCYDPYEIRDAKERIWRVVADSSLTDVPVGLRAEVVTPILSYGDITDLQEVIRAVRRCGGHSSSKTGVHIHLDCSQFDGKSLINLAKLYHKQEALILKAFGVSEERMNRYAKPMNPEFIRRIEKCRTREVSEINRLWYGYHKANPQRYDPERYAAVNFTSYLIRGSVEFRLFQFQAEKLHAGMLRAWIVFVLSLGARALSCRGTSSRKREFDPDSARYDFRVFLLHLGLIGDEFKSVRAHLLNLMPGDSAWKHGRKIAVKEVK
ncbi:MAG: amidoligase family protein [Armatimonadota bacterium]